MIHLILRERIPQIPLPFVPRSAGVNRFAGAGPKEDAPGIDAVEICTVAEGECEIEQRGLPIRLSAGQSLYKLPGEHRRKTVLSASGAVIYWATFDGAGAETFMRSYGYPAGALDTGACPVGLYEEIAGGLSAGTDHAFRRLTAVYAELTAGLVAPPTDPEAGERLFSDCILRMRTRYTDPSFNVDALTAELGVHRTTLLRLFRKKLGTTPLEYLRRCRIEHAMYLLRSTVVPVAEVAASSGFSRSNYFCRVIRRHCGATPESLRAGRREV